MVSGFFTLFDDIAILMDDVAAMSKVATKKASGLLADDLAVNAEKASGFVSARELPILWRITKGSFLNKLIILPIAFFLSAYLPAAIVPILFLGGVYLAYEGVEKIVEYLFHKKEKKENTGTKSSTETERTAYENKKIKSAILVDFILSIEIIIIVLGPVMEEPLMVQILVVSIVAFIATVGVYGLVALLVRIDDLGFKLIALSNDKPSLKKSIGNLLVRALPTIIRALTFIGTIAMILVAGGIFVHNIHFLHDLLSFLPSILGEFLVGLLVGFTALLMVKLYLSIFKKVEKTV